MSFRFPNAANIEWLERLRARTDKSKNQLKAIRYYTNLFRATPKWLSDAQIDEMRMIYNKAHKRRWCVDHIVPLASPLVCGLHVPWNLQGVPRRVNDKKGNTWWPDGPFEQGAIEFETQLSLWTSPPSPSRNIREA